MAVTRSMPIDQIKAFDVHEFDTKVMEPFIEEFPKHKEGYLVFCDTMRRLDSDVTLLCIGSLINESDNYRTVPKDILFLIDLLDTYGLHEPFYLVET